MECSKDMLVCLAATARDIGEPHVNLSVLGVPVTVSTDLYDIVANHDGPSVSLAWDDATLTVSNTDGGVMATFELKF